MYASVIPVSFLFIAIITVLDGKKYLNVFNGILGMALGAYVGAFFGKLIFESLFFQIILLILFIYAGYQLKRIKKIELFLISGFAFALLALILFTALNMTGGGLIFFVVFFFLFGIVFPYYYYYDIFITVSSAFFGANIIYISYFYGIENITRNVFEIFNYPYAFNKFFFLYYKHFFFFLLMTTFLLLFSFYFQKIKNRKNLDKKLLILNNALNESGYLFAIFFFLTEALRIITDVDTLYVFGISIFSFPILTFLTYWMIGFIRKQEQIDTMIDARKGYKVFMYIFIYSVISVPLISYLSNFGKYSIFDMFKGELAVMLPKLIFTFLILPICIYMIYPKKNNDN